MLTVVVGVLIPHPRLFHRPSVANPEEKDPSTETSEEETERVLAAIDPGLVAFSSDKGGVPYYRLHRVVAKAITRKKFIFVSGSKRPIWR